MNWIVDARLLHTRIVTRLLRKTVNASLEDNIFRMGAALAYYTLFSLAPLLLISVAVAGLVFGEKAAQGGIVSQIQGLIGDEGAQAVQTIMASAHRPASGAFAGVLGVGVLILGATGAFNEIYTALNNIWRTEPAGTHGALSGAWSMVKARLLSFGLVLVLGFLMLASLLVSALLSAIAKFAGTLIPVPPFLLNVAETVFTTIVLAALFAMIFRILPEKRIAWGDVWIGGLVTAVMFSLGKFLIGIYIGKSLPASSYGAAGSVIVLIAWIYYSALILYFGAEFTREYAEEFGSRSETVNAAEAASPERVTARAHHA
ncbi:MAG: YihY/virulence factor BrkB family protein [Acidobacteria bacterium]|nr:YihY/virulence factor BrkB family protein [Acidobacteriota bacterium]